MTRFQSRAVILLLLAGALGSFYWFQFTFSADLMAVWLAAKFLAMGQPELVYAPLTDYFLMYPPLEWRDYMETHYEYTGPIFPFLYPPLWAKVFGVVSGMNFWWLAYFTLAVNASIQMATLGLALRAAQPKNISPVLFVLVGLVFLFGTHLGTLTLRQNQLQIFVNFLLVLTVERSRAKDDFSAGIALALAASIKIYPAVFAIFWLATRNWKGFSAFFVSGLALGLLSILLAGWDLHEEFLRNIALVARSTIVTAITFNLDATLAQLIFIDDLNRIPGLEPPTEATPTPGWWGMERPILSRVASTGLAIAFLWWSVRKYMVAGHEERHTAIWPFILAVFPLTLPLTWVYYFVPAGVFSAVLIDKLGWTRGLPILVVTLVLIFGPFIRFYRLSYFYYNGSYIMYQIGGFIAFSLLAYGFWQVVRSYRNK